jgi:hypothetical protein
LLVVLVAAPTQPVAAVALVGILPFQRKRLQPEMYTQSQWALVAQVVTPAITEVIHQ